MIAVVVVRGGVLPSGADEAVAEAGGSAVLVGDGVRRAAGALVGPSGRVRVAEVGAFAPAAWAVALAPVLAAEDVVILPASPDGRDLAPRLAAALGRRLLAGATSISGDRVVLVRQGGLVAEEHEPGGPFVATLVPGCRGVEPGGGPPAVTALALEVVPAGDADVVEVLAPDPATVDLAEATRIVTGGGGLGGPGPFAVLERVALALGASFGATRVASDAGWAPADRYIGTTGVTVDPRLYVALAVSGAVQHVTGLGHPDHIVAVNTDPSAPLMGVADLAIVADAGAVLDQLADRLGIDRDVDA